MLGVPCVVAAEDTATVRAEIEAKRSLAARLRQVKATGRIVLELPSDQTQLKDLPDLALEDGDRFLVPARGSTVSVIGSVYNENAFIYRPGKRVSDYLKQAGGATKDADDGSIYVVRADGSVVSKRQQGTLFGSIDGEALTPGDTIVVPEYINKTSWIRDIKDYTQILYQFGLGAAGLKVLRGN